jgi:NADH dehydrogenase
MEAAQQTRPAALDATRSSRATLYLLAAATAIGALGLAAGGSAGALVAEDVTGSTAWAGLPLGVLVAGSAAGALLIARQTSRAGRGSGLVLGYGVGTAGATVVIVATVLDDFVLLLAGSAALGAANAAIFLTRYAAADLGGEATRGRALGVVLFATALGAVASPNLLGPSGDLAEAFGLSRLSGLYVVALVAFAVAGLLLTALPREHRPVGERAVADRELRRGLTSARVALLVLAGTNLVMVAVMAIAPIHLTHHGHSLDVVGVVIGVHVLCMFAPAPLTGRLADRAGSAVVAGLGAAFLIVAGLSGALLDLSNGFQMTAVLALLGLAWNAGVVGGSTMLVASVPASLRPRTEGIGEVAMGLAAGAGAPIAGLIVAFGDFTTLSLAGASAGVLIIVALRLGGHTESDTQRRESRHRVVVVGGGFAGIQAVRGLRRAPVDVTLVDRQNHALFQPLVYQVATGALSPAEIASPLRTIFRRQRNVRVLLAEVTGFDLDRREIVLERLPHREGEARLAYDTLIVAAGSQYSYFGQDDWQAHAPQLKSLVGAIEIRSRILAAFEAAEAEADPDRRRGWLTFVVVGGGPTGVEMAGQIAELAHDTLRCDFRTADPVTARVLLVEAADRVLPGFPEPLSRKAGRALEQLGVTSLTAHEVVSVTADAVGIRAPGGEVEHVETHTTIWAAGVTASELAPRLAHASGLDVDRAGRITVAPDLTLPGHPEVFALGDMVRVQAANRTPAPLPGLAPVAMQEGRYAAQAVRARLRNKAPGPFRYRDRGNMATIGRSKAVADIGGLHLSGFPAWALWLLIHLFYLHGLQNRLFVVLRWTFSFLTRGRGARLIVLEAGRGRAERATPHGLPATPTRSRASEPALTRRRNPYEHVDRAA